MKQKEQFLYTVPNAKMIAIYNAGLLDLEGHLTELLDDVHPLQPLVYVPDLAEDVLCAGQDGGQCLVIKK